MKKQTDKKLSLVVNDAQREGLGVVEIFEKRQLTTEANVVLKVEVMN